MAIDELDLSAIAPGTPIRAANTGSWFDLGYPTSADRLVAAAVTGSGVIGARTFAAGANSASRSIAGARQTEGRIGWKMEFMSSLSATTAYFEMIALRFNTAAGFLVDIGIRHNSTTLKRYPASRNNFAYIGQANAGNAFDLDAGEKWSFEVYWDGLDATVYAWIGEDVSDVADFIWTGTMAQAPTNFMLANDSNDGVDAILYDVWISDGERQPGPPTPGTLSWIGNWDARSTSVQVVGKVADAAAVSLTINGSTIAGVPDANGYFRLTATGLAASVPYTWDLKVDGASRQAGEIKTLPGATSATHRVVHSSCYDADTSAVFGLIAARDPDFVFQGGDRMYTFITGGAFGSVSPTDPDVLRPMRELAFAAINNRQLVDYNYPLMHIYSDCDGGGGNADSTVGGLATGAVQSVWRQQTANLDLPLAASGARSFVVGNIRYIITDETTNASAKGNTDDASKTKLGAAQKAWLLAELTAAAAAKQGVIWFGDGPFHPPTTSSGTGNEWSRYNNERQQIVTHIQSTGVLLVRANGDRHALAADDGTNNPFGGFPTVNAAPMHTTALPYGMTANEGTWPTVSTNSSRQYGVIDATWDGEVATARFRGYSSTNALPTEELRYDLTVTFDYAEGFVFIEWNGTTETVLTPIEWNGTTETVLTPVEQV